LFRQREPRICGLVGQKADSTGIGAVHLEWTVVDGEGGHRWSCALRARSGAARLDAALALDLDGAALLEDEQALSFS